VDPLLGERGHVRELDAVVDAERERRVGQRVGADGLAFGAQHRQHAGEIALALRVVAAEAVERGQERAAVEDVEAGVDLSDGELLGRRVARGLGLHHAVDGAVGGADHAPVAARVVELHRGDRRGGARIGVGGNGGGDRLAGDERHVAVDHDHRRVGVDLRRRGGDGVAGAERSLLDRRLGPLGQVLGEQPLGVVDDDHALRAGRARREQRPQDHG
jgi:hypothetical protein